MLRQNTLAQQTPKIIPRNIKILTLKRYCEPK